MQDALVKRKIIRFSVILFCLLAVLYPLWVGISSRYWTLGSELLSNIFPLLGILAFTLLWLHSISGVFESWLRKYFDFDWFIYTTSMLIFISFVLHPFLLLIYSDFSFTRAFSYADMRYIWLGVIGFLLLITYDIGKFLKNHDFFVRNWDKILVISTIGFLLTFFHSLVIGSDLQSGTLRIVWIFYGITAILSTIYTYGIKKFLG